MKLNLFALLFFSLPIIGVSQDYGLKFSSHETVVDQRTTLKLSNDICISESARLNFKFRFIEGSKGYFGYLFRMMTLKGLNIDLIFKPSSPDYKFNLVVGKKLKGLKFDLDSIYEWNTISVLLDIKGDKIAVISGDTIVREKDVGFEGDECIAIVFGRSPIPGIRSIDLPPMVVKDIQLSVNDKLAYYWPLNETEGNIAHDTISGVNADVINPGWILKNFQNWHLHKSLKFHGPVSVAFNSIDEAVMILSNDSLVSVSLDDSQIQSFPINEDSKFVYQGDQAIFYKSRNEFININLTHRSLTFFNLNDSTLKRNHPVVYSKLPQFWHHNKIINPVDSSIIMIGGYGNLTYKNLVQRYDVQSKKWDTVRLKGDFISPRYLFGLGNHKDVSYLIGGYGSLTGDQLLYPETYRDFYKIYWKKLYVEKIYELPLEEEPFVFANSIVITDDSSYYGLKFPHFKFKSNLQLIKGSLSKPEYHPIGDTIPFLFHDINSFADLFFAKKSKLLVAVTTYFDNASNETNVHIYKIAFPPIADSAQAAYGPSSQKDYTVIIVLIISGLLLAAAIIFYFKSNRFASKALHPPQDNAEGAVPFSESSSENINIEANRIRFFGGFYVFASDGEEITNRFTPLLKELFLLIALNTLRYGKGISSQKLDEILWFDKSEKSARNNRSVNITKLRLILNEIGIELSKSTGYWKINIENGKVSIDYDEYLKIIHQRKGLKRNQIDELIQIIENGAFLHNVQYEWLDSFKSMVSTEVITLFNDYLKTAKIEEDYEHVMHVIKCIYVFDPVNEEAMQIECKALSHMGNHTLAKNAYEKFKKEYFALYDEDYSKTFQEIIES